MNSPKGHNALQIVAIIYLAICPLAKDSKENESAVAAAMHTKTLQHEVCLYHLHVCCAYSLHACVVEFVRGITAAQHPQSNRECSR